MKYLLHRDDMFLQDDGVRVSPIHSSKGMGFKVVFIPGLTERIFPWAGIDIKSASTEEKTSHTEMQLLLLYVGMTRARHLLFITYPMRDGRGHPAKPSWFLNKITD